MARKNREREALQAVLEALAWAREVNPGDDQSEWLGAVDNIEHHCLAKVRRALRAQPLEDARPFRTLLGAARPYVYEVTTHDAGDEVRNPHATAARRLLARIDRALSPSSS